MLTGNSATHAHHWIIPKMNSVGCQYLSHWGSGYTDLFRYDACMYIFIFSTTSIVLKSSSKMLLYNKRTAVSALTAHISKAILFNKIWISLIRLTWCACQPVNKYHPLIQLQCINGCISFGHGNCFFCFVLCVFFFPLVSINLSFELGLEDLVLASDAMIFAQYTRMCKTINACYALIITMLNWMIFDERYNYAQCLGKIQSFLLLFFIHCYCLFCMIWNNTIRATALADFWNMHNWKWSDERRFCLRIIKISNNCLCVCAYSDGQIIRIIQKFIELKFIHALNRN